MDMKSRSLTLIVIAVLLLAGCGGSEQDPTATPVPTLSVEERAEFAAGLAQNPLRMVIRPADIVPERIASILVGELGVRRSQVNPDTELRDDLDLEDDLAVLNEPLQRDFRVDIHPEDAESIVTVADLVGYVQDRLGEQVSAAIFNRTSLYVDVILVDDYSRALEALCASGTGIVSIPWLDGITYAVATAQNCGQPGLQVAVAQSERDLFPEITGPEATAEATAEATGEPTEEVTVEATAESTGEDEPEPTPTETEAPTDTPEPPTPTPSPEPDEQGASTSASDTGGIQTGAPGVIVANADLGSADVQLVVGRAYCRLGVEDFYTWFLPTLVMEANGIDALRDPEAIVDYPDEHRLVSAVANGDCAMTGLSQTAFDALDADLRENLRVVETTVDFPHGVLMYPLEIGVGVRLSLNEQLAALAEDPADGRTLQMLLGQDALIPVQPEDFAPLSAFLETTGLDLAQLGN